MYILCWQYAFKYRLQKQHFRISTYYYHVHRQIFLWCTL